MLLDVPGRFKRSLVKQSRRYIVFGVADIKTIFKIITWKVSFRLRTYPTQNINDTILLCLNLVVNGGSIINNA